MFISWCSFHIFGIVPVVRVAVDNGHTQPLLMNSEAMEQDEDREEGEEENNDAEEAQKPVTSIVVAYRLLSPSVKVRSQSTFAFILLYEF